MPLFDFRCPGCQSDFEALTKKGEAPPPCPSCGAPQTTKLISGFAIAGRRTTTHHHDSKAPVRNDGGPHDAIGNQAAALRAKGKATCC